MNKLIKMLKLLHSGTDVGSGLGESWCETCEEKIDKD